MPVRAMDDEDIFVFWESLDAEEYDQMMRRFAEENGLLEAFKCPTSTRSSERK